MIVDSHAHIFPYLGGPNGFPTVRDHLLFLQLYAATHSNPVRRLRDHIPADDRRPLAGPPVSPAALLEANFRVGRFGRLEWTLDGEDYYLQFFPPSLQQMESPPEFMLQQMAHAGVDCAVLQNAHLYGRLDEYFAEAMRRYPGKFIGLASVDEARADSPEELGRLRRSVTELRLPGLYYANRGLFTQGYRRGFDDESFEGFWEEVRRLRIPVFWEIQGVPEPSRENLLKELERLNRWADRFTPTALRRTWCLTRPSRFFASSAGSSSCLKSSTRSTGAGTTVIRIRNCGRCSGASTTWSGLAAWSGVRTCQTSSGTALTASPSITCWSTWISSRGQSWT